MIHQLRLFLFIFVSMCPLTQAIAGGKRSSRGAWPYFVALRNESNGLVCGGTIISPDTILTAARCFNGPSSSSSATNFVYLGGGGGGDTFFQHLKLSIASYILHPRYKGNVNPAIWDHDIALVKLAAPIKFGPRKGIVDRVCLPGADDRPDRSTCIVVGMGRQRARGPTMNELFEVELPLDDECPQWKETRDKAWLCTNSQSLGDVKKGPCPFDAGGPLLCPLAGQPKVYLQFGLTFTNMPGCGGTGIYLPLIDYRDWIVKTAEDGH